MADRLKLRAEDEEDLAVISAILQDALVTVGEMIYQPEEGRFAMVVNRFRWEAQPQEGGRFERIHSGLSFEGVSSAKTRGFDHRDADRILEILALHHEPGAVLFDFSGDGALRLESPRILCRFEDIGEPWPTPWRPRHPIEGR
jgi:hypothetical protein